MSSLSLYGHNFKPAGNTARLSSLTFLANSFFSFLRYYFSLLRSPTSPPPPPSTSWCLYLVISGENQCNPSTWIPFLLTYCNLPSFTFYWLIPTGMQTHLQITHLQKCKQTSPFFVLFPKETFSLDLSFLAVTLPHLQLFHPPLQ